MIQRRSLLAGLLGGAAAAGVPSAAEAAKKRTGNFGPYNIPSRSMGNGLVFFGGCIRFETMGNPYIHFNEHHTSVGLVEIGIESDGDVRVTFDRVTPVVTGFIEEDESFSAANISAGFSGGSGSIDIRFGLNGTRLMPSDSRLWKSNRNLWIAVIGLDPTF